MIVKAGAPGATEIYLTSEVRDIQTFPIEAHWTDEGWKVFKLEYNAAIGGFPVIFQMGNVGVEGAADGSTLALAVKVRRESGEVSYIVTNLPVWLMNDKGDTIERYN